MDTYEAFRRINDLMKMPKPTNAAEGEAILTELVQCGLVVLEEFLRNVRTIADNSHKGF